VSGLLIFWQQITRLLEESRFDIESDASLSRACSLELKDHCGDIPKGDGQSLFCLPVFFVQFRSLDHM